MSENGRVIDIIAKLHADPASLIKTQKEFDAALRASGKNLDVEREGLKVRDEHAKATARQIQLEQELQQQRAKTAALQDHVTKLAERHAKVKADEVAVAERVAELEERASAAQLRQVELADRIRDRRKAGERVGGLHAEQLQNIAEINSAMEALAAGRDELDKATARSGKFEGDLGNVRAKEADALRELKQLEEEHAANRQRLTKLDQSHIAVQEKLSQVYMQQRQHLRSLHQEEERGTRRRASRSASSDTPPPRQSGGSGGRGGGGGGGHVYRNASAFGDLFRGVPGSVGGPLGAIFGPLALADMVSYTEAVTTASQALALLPAAASAAGAAIGTLAMGMHGFDDAIKNINDPQKFVEAIEHLAPAAQQAALEIQTLVQGPLGQLQRMVQEDLFKGVAAQIDGLATTFEPQIKGLTTGIATAFNGMFSSFTGELQANHGGIDQIVNNITSAFQRLEPAVKPFTDALVTITQVGSSFLPQIADTISTMATSFNAFIQQAATDGSLQNFIQKGIDAIGVLGQAALDLGQQLFDLFGNQSPEEMRKNIDDIVGSMVLLATIVQDVAHVINDWKPLIEAVGIGFAIFKADGVIGKALTGMGSMLGKGAGGIGAALDALPAAAAAAGEGMTAGLGAAALMLGDLAIAAGVVVGAMELLKQKPADLDNPAQRFMNANPNLPKVPDFGPDGPSREFMLQHPELWPNNPAAPKPPGAGGAGSGGYQDKPIQDYRNFMPQLAIQLPQGMQALPGVTVAPGAPAPLPGTAGAMFPGSPGARPQLEYGTDGTPFAHPELGYRKVNSAELGNSASELQKAAIELGKANAALNGVQKNSLATQEELLDAQMKQADAQRGFNEKQLEYAKNSMGKWTKVDANMAVFGEIGAHLDKDLGFSKGLPGLADNLVKFVASLATAPMMGKLAQEASIGDGSYGALGMMFGGYGSKTGVGPESFANSGVVGLGGASATASSNINDLATAAANATRSLSGQPNSGAGGSGAPTGGGWWPNLTNLPGMANAVPGGNYSGDAALLANVPAGHYGPAADLIHGLADCSGAVGNLVDIVKGQTSPDRLNTGNAASWLTERGFLPTDHPMPGTFQVGYNPEHMQATLPGGTNFNYGSEEAAQARGINGAGAWDPTGGGSGAFTSHYYLPVGQAPAAAPGAPVGPLNSPADIAQMIYQQAMARGYSPHDSQSIAAYANGESSYRPGVSGGPQGGSGAADEVIGLFQEKPAFARAGGIDPSQRSDPVANATAYLNQLEKYRNMPIEQALPTLSSGGPLASGPGAQPQDWGRLMADTGRLLGLPNGGGQGLPIPAGPKLDFSGVGGGDPFGFSKTPSSPSNSIADLLHSSKPGDMGFSKPPASPSNGIADFLHSAPPAMPHAAQQYTPQAPPQAQQGWQPNSSGGVGAGNGALGAAMSAASMAANAFAPGAGAAAQTAMQLTNRTIQFGGQLAGIAAEGLLDTFMPSDPDSGKNPIKDSWLWRAAGAIAGATPALGSGAGLMDRVALKKQQDDAQSQQGGDTNTTIHNAPVNMFNIAQGQNQSGKSLAQDVAQQLTLNAGNQFGGQP